MISGKIDILFPSHSHSSNHKYSQQMNFPCGIKCVPVVRLICSCLGGISGVALGVRNQKTFPDTIFTPFVMGIFGSLFGCLVSELLTRGVKMITF
jgi:hypothetical protein